MTTKTCEDSGDVPTKASRTITLEMGGVRFSAALPPKWQMLPQQSDLSAGLAAFTIPWQGPTEQVNSLFFDASADLSVPASLAELAATVMDSAACKGPTPCTELCRATLTEDGMLISVKKPHAVYVESWRTGRPGRALRCGVEVSDLVAPVGRTWLTDESQVQRARLTSEAICRSVKLLP